jgi:3-oxoacyl-[acyl-carrier protein] reductase
MDMELSGQQFLVCGASDGFGKQVAEALVAEGAQVLAVARNEQKLQQLAKEHDGLLEYLVGDLFDDVFLDQMIEQVKEMNLSGLFVNAGGPPAMGFLESKINDWDQAYKSVVRWKLKLVKALLPGFEERRYGRILFLESASIRQPVNDLVLSNAMRMAIAGAAKTLSLEVADKGINVNILAPGFHKTSAVDRIIAKKMEAKGISAEEAEEQITSNIPVGFAGDPARLASLAVWLLSPKAEFVTGQTYVLDGGNTKFSLG